MKKTTLGRLAGVAIFGLFGVVALTNRAEAPVHEEVFSQIPEEVIEENMVVEETTIDFEVENTSEKASVKTTVKCPAEERIQATMESSTKVAETSAVVEAPAEIVVTDNSKELNDTAKAVEAAKDNRIYSC